MSEVSSNHPISNNIVDAIFNTEHTVSENAFEKLSMSTTKKVLIGIFTLGIGTAVFKHIENRARQQAREVVALKNKLMTHNFDEQGPFTAKINGTNIKVELDHDGKLKAVETLRNGKEDVTKSPMTQKELVKRLEDDIVTHTDFYGKAAAMRVMQDNIPAIENPYSDEAGRARELGLKVLCQKSGSSPNEFSAIPNRLLAHMAHWALNDAIDVNEFMKNSMDAVCNRDLINSEDVNLLAARQIQREQSADWDPNTVRMPDRANQAQAAAIDPDVQKVKNFLSNLVYPQDSFRHDNLLNEPGKMTKGYVLANLETIELIRSNPSLLAQADPALAAIMIGGGEDSEPPLEVVAAMDQGSEDSQQSLQNVMIGRFFQSIGLDGVSPEATAEELEISLENAPLERFVALENKLNEVVDSFFAQMQDTINNDRERGFGSIFTSNTSTSTTAGAAASAGQTELTPRQRLENIVNQGIDVNTNGYGRFLKIVSETYFTSASNIDKRSMYASYIRETDADSSEGKRMGAILKGAGPIMQKILQGLNTAGMDPELQLALQDMKSNLNPISDKVIKAHLADIVERSHGQIRSIEVQKSLGAASVGQALLCTITTAQGETKECVIKILRPDVQNRAQREKELFLAAAEQVDGMTTTFAGQLKRITEELDLTKEAENIKLGQVYTKAGHTNVKSMQLNPLVETTPNVMVLERAPGNTVDGMIKELHQRILNIQSEFAKKDEDGKVKLDERGRVVYKDDLTQEEAVQIQNRLLEVHEEYKQCQEQLIQLSSMWVTQGLYADSGFYHGDLHAGNIMFDKDAGTTVIDFGNATKLDSEQQKHVTRMVASASAGDPTLFLKAYKDLLTNKGKAVFENLERDSQVTDLVKGIFDIDKKVEDTGLRISAVLQELQKLGLELPAAIFNFSQCQMRMQNTVDTINAALTQLRQEITSVYGDPRPQVMDPERALTRREGNIVETVRADISEAIERGDDTARIGEIISNAVTAEIDNFKATLNNPAFVLRPILMHVLEPDAEGNTRAHTTLDRFERQNQDLADIRDRIKSKIETFKRTYNIAANDDVITEIRAAVTRTSSGTPTTPAEGRQAELASIVEDYKSYASEYAQMAASIVSEKADHTREVVAACSVRDHTFFDAMADVVAANYRSTLNRIGLLYALRHGTQA